jgi:hypothetical protein
MHNIHHAVVDYSSYREEEEEAEAWSTCSLDDTGSDDRSEVNTVVLSQKCP